MVKNLSGGDFGKTELLGISVLRQAEKLGICRTSTAQRLDGLHGSRNAGRACWISAPRWLCAANARENLKGRLACCAQCAFYRTVQREKGEKLQSIAELMPTFGPL